MRATRPANFVASFYYVIMSYMVKKTEEYETLPFSPTSCSYLSFLASRYSTQYTVRKQPQLMSCGDTGFHRRAEEW